MFDILNLSKSEYNPIKNIGLRYIIVCIRMLNELLNYSCRKSGCWALDQKKRKKPTPISNIFQFFEEYSMLGLSVYAWLHTLKLNTCTLHTRSDTVNREITTY